MKFIAAFLLAALSMLAQPRYTREQLRVGVTVSPGVIVGLLESAESSERTSGLMLTLRVTGPAAKRIWPKAGAETVALIDVFYQKLLNDADQRALGIGTNNPAGSKPFPILLHKTATVQMWLASTWIADGSIEIPFEQIEFIRVRIFRPGFQAGEIEVAGVAVPMRKKHDR